MQQNLIAKKAKHFYTILFSWTFPSIFKKMKKTRTLIGPLAH